MFGFGSKKSVTATEVALAIFGFYTQLVQSNSHHVLLARAGPVGQDIQERDPDAFNAEMGVLILFLISEGSEGLPDEDFKKVFSRLGELVLSHVSNATEREGVSDALEGRMGVYKMLSRTPDMLISLACENLLGKRLGPRFEKVEKGVVLRGRAISLEGWVRMLYSQVISAQRDMIRSVMRKNEIVDE